MGNQAPKNIQQSNFNNSHPQFRSAKSVVTEQHQKFIEAKFKIQNQQFDQWKNSLQGKIQRIKSDYLLLPQRMHYSHEEGLCGNTGTLTVLYSQFQYTLADIIRQRQQSGVLFTEGEIWYVLYALVASRQDLKAHGYTIGDIRPQNIFIQKDGKIKIGSKYSYPNEVQNYNKVLDIDASSQVYLLAPQQFTSQKDSKNFTRIKAEIFSIGATLICAATLDNFSKVYKNKNFDAGSLNEKKRGWAHNERYSGIFRSILLSLVEENVNERLGQQQLWQFISEHRKDILDKVEFILYKVPQKVQRTFQTLNQKYF